MRTLALLLLCLPLFSYAGQEVGNGGDLLICSVGANKTYELYDLFEGRTRHKFKLSPPAGSDPISIVSELIARLDSINPTRANLYRSWLASFYSETEFVADGRLIDVPDTGDGYIPTDCELRQFAVQRTTNFPGEKRYLIDQNLWRDPAATNQVKASLIFHELILREAISAPHGQGNSIGTRYINALVHANSLPADSLTWLNTLNLAGFRSGDYRHNFGQFRLVWEDGFELTDAGDPVGEISGGDLNWKQIRGAFDPYIFGIRIADDGLAGWARLREAAAFEGDILGLYAHGNVRMLDFYRNEISTVYFDGSGEIRVGNRSFAFFGADTQIKARQEDMGGPACDHFLHHGTFTTRIQGKNLELDTACLNGNVLSSFMLTNNETLKDLKGKDVEIKAGATCSINSDELLLSCDK